jgi:hypothetical protein
MTIEEFIEREHILASITTGFGKAEDEYVAIRTTTSIVTCSRKKEQSCHCNGPLFRFYKH